MVGSRTLAIAATKSKEKHHQKDAGTGLPRLAPEELHRVRMLQKVNFIKSISLVIVHGYFTATGFISLSCLVLLEFIQFDSLNRIS